ncbi:Hypp5586 [Branchiostoma lanceolatum]|uniref:Hypp5586 protein n=1 Tax=Branchiostoma lanceolatum TaxID=7740 RepID=A0A8J9VQE4_BRALA|nr:Hypp5586 [Branchiostoma lanceolatum]
MAVFRQVYFVFLICGALFAQLPTTDGSVSNPGVQSDDVLIDNTSRDDVTPNHCNLRPQLDITDTNTDHISVHHRHVAISVYSILHGNGTDRGYPKADAVLSISIVRDAFADGHPNSNTRFAIIGIIRDVINTAIGTFRPDAISSNTVQCGSPTSQSEYHLVTSIGICSEDLGTGDVDDVIADDVIALSDDVGLHSNNGDCSATRDANISDDYFNVTIGHAFINTHRWNTEFESDQSDLSYNLDHANHLFPTNPS